jgi:hypothetical protein
MEREKKERERVNARLRGRVRYYQNEFDRRLETAELQTKEEKGEGMEVPKVTIEARKHLRDGTEEGSTI